MQRPRYFENHQKVRSEHIFFGIFNSELVFSIRIILVYKVLSEENAF